MVSQSAFGLGHRDLVHLSAVGLGTIEFVVRLSVVGLPGRHNIEFEGGRFLEFFFHFSTGLCCQIVFLLVRIYVLYLMSNISAN